MASSSKLWGTTRGNAIDYGDLIHEMMSLIKTTQDVEEVINQYINQGILDDREIEKITKIINDIVSHDQLKEYFAENLIIYNEREIVGAKEQVIIPDRLVVDTHKNVVIIDYKTGTPLQSHKRQLEAYESVLELLDYSVQKKILIYINDSISIEEF